MYVGHGVGMMWTAVWSENDLGTGKHLPVCLSTVRSDFSLTEICFCFVCLNNFVLLIWTQISCGCSLAFWSLAWYDAHNKNHPLGKQNWLNVDCGYSQFSYEFRNLIPWSNLWYKNIENDEKADYQNGLVRKSLRSGLQFPTTTSNSNSIVQYITESGVDVVEKCAQGQKVSICVIAIADNSTHTAIGQDLDRSTSTPLRSSTAWEWSLQSTPSLFHTNQ